MSGNLASGRAIAGEGQADCDFTVRERRSWAEVGDADGAGGGRAARPYWAAWADALPMLHARLPEHAYAWSEELEFAQANVAHVEFFRRLPLGLQEAELARRQLVAEGYRNCPTWEDIRAGVLPKNPAPLERAPGEWCRGWQFYASRVRDTHYLDFEVRPRSSPTERA